MATENSNVIPATSGLSLGSSFQRWNLFAQTVDLASFGQGNGFNSFKYAQTVITASGPIVPRSGSVVLDSPTLLDLTLETPVPGDEDGLVISIWSAQAAPHTITLLSTGSSSVAPFNNATQSVATFANSVGSSLTLEAYNGNWYVRAPNGISLS